MVADALFKLFMMAQIAVFRLTNGKAMANMRGMPVLLLTTVGRKTKKVRTTPLMYIKDGESYVVTASNNGRDQYPGWFRNLQATPDVRIEVPGQGLMVTASVASAVDHTRLWPQLVAKAPFFEGYRKGTSRPIPIVILKTR
jgi:F420H(2)-dependent quinone reductase